MRGMHSHYKEMLGELDKCYLGIEKDTHMKYKVFLDKWKAQMERKTMGLKTAYEEEHKLREELRTWAELNMIALQDKVKELSEDKKRSLERLDLVMAGGSKEMDGMRKSLEQEYQGKIEKVQLEKQKMLAECKLLEAKASARSTEIAGLIIELILKNVEAKIAPAALPLPLPIPASPGKKPASEKSNLEISKLKEENARLQQELKSGKKTESPAPPKGLATDPTVLVEKEKEKLKKTMEDQELKYQRILGEVTSERDSLKSELNAFTASLAAPSDSDDPTTHVLRSQIVLLTTELGSAREKVSGLEGQASQVRALQDSLAKKNAELLELSKKPAEAKTQISADVNERITAKDEDIQRLNQEIHELKSQVEALTTVPERPHVRPSKKGPARESEETTELRDALERLKMHNEILKKQAEESKALSSVELDSLKGELKDARDLISHLEAGRGGNAADLGAALELKQALARIAELEAMGGTSEAEQKLQLATQQVEFLQSQLKDSGKSVAAFPAEELARLNEEIAQANLTIARLNSELNSGQQGNTQELLEELSVLKSENASLKSSDKSGKLLELTEKIKSLQEELNKRPTAEEMGKLSQVIKDQEKQIKDFSSSQGQQIKELNSTIEELKLAHASLIKDMEVKASSASRESKEVIAKITGQLADLEKVRSQLDKQLQSELDGKAKMTAELEQVRKVAGEAAGLAKKVEELLATVAVLQEKNNTKEQELKDSLRQRKLLHNQLEDLKGKIRVFCRVRPLSKGELERGCNNITTIVDEFTITCDSKSGIKPFVYDSVFGPNSTQDEVFEDTRRVVQSSIDGYNVCVFAYGQTGSGKTYTMTGDERNPGVTPRAMDELYNILNHLPNHYRWKVTCYMVEIYLDTLVDLFIPKDFRGTPPSLTIKKDIKGIVVIPEATLFEVKSSREIMAKFDEGNLMRHTSSTKMNDVSSRSHLVFGVMIDVTNTETNQRTVGKLSLVDLAGSERVSKTEATAERLKEGRAINKSLSALGDVISALSSNESHIPYRNNKLTMLMSDSLGGTAKTLMFVNVSPASYNLEETTMSLYYAARVKLITNDPSKNIESKEMSTLKQEILSVSGERDKYKAVLEKNGFNISNLEEIPESKQDEFDDAKYDDL